MTAGGDSVVARRVATAEICREAATSVVERIVQEASRAASLLGFGRDAAKRYADGITETLPYAFDTLAMPDGPEREAHIAAFHVAQEIIRRQLERLLFRTP